MKPDLRDALLRCETNLDDAIDRLSGDEALYEYCLGCFLEDQTMQDLENALNEREWDNAFTAVHALKGMAGNMGFIPLFHASAEMVVIIRAGRINDMNAYYLKLKQCYDEIKLVILNNA